MGQVIHDVLEVKDGDACFLEQLQFSGILYFVDDQFSRPVAVEKPVPQFNLFGVDELFLYPFGNSLFQFGLCSFLSTIRANAAGFLKLLRNLCDLL